MLALLPLLTALEPVLTSFIAGGSVEAAFDALTVAEWTKLVLAVAPLLDKELHPELNKLLMELAPHLGQVGKAIEKYGPTEAAAVVLAKHYATVNGNAAIKMQEQRDKDY